MATTKASCEHPHNKTTELLRPSVDTDHVQMLAELKYFISILTQDTRVVNVSYIRRWQREQSGPEVDEIENSISRAIMWDTFSALLHTGCPSREGRDQLQKVWYTLKNLFFLPHKTKTHNTCVLLTTKQ